MVNEYHRILRAALKQGERWDLVPANVAERATPPTMPKRSITAPPPERVAELIDAAAQSRTPDLAAFILVAALTGLRRGEMCGLRFADVDWTSPAITVRRSVWQIGARSGVKLPKTHQIRRLPIGPRVLAALRLRWEQATANADATEVALSSEAYVFSPDVDGVRPLMPRHRDASLRSVVCQARAMGVRAVSTICATTPRAS